MSHYPDQIERDAMCGIEKQIAAHCNQDVTLGCPTCETALDELLNGYGDKWLECPECEKEVETDEAVSL